MSNISCTTTDFNGVRDEVVKLRASGIGPRQIAKILGLSAKSVENIIHSEFVERFGNRQQMVIQTAMTLDMLARPLIEKYHKDHAEGHIDRRDVEVILKVVESKKKLFALDQPSRLEVIHLDEMSNEQLNAELSRLGVKVEPLPIEAHQEVKAEIVDDAEVEVVPSTI